MSRPTPPPLRIVSGGQTGVDRAALDVALELGLPVGGWCPAGRAAEDGRIPGRYPLRETPSPDPAVRTRWNVRDSDAVLVLSPAPLTGGTALTARVARELGRPLLVVDPRDPEALPHAAAWLRRVAPRTLDVAGPRESEVPGIAEAARTFLRALLSDAAAAEPSPTLGP